MQAWFSICVGWFVGTGGIALVTLAFDLYFDAALNSFGEHPMIGMSTSSGLVKDCFVEQNALPHPWWQSKDISFSEEGLGLHLFKP